MRTTRHPFYGKLCSRTPSKPCVKATFLLRFLPCLTPVGLGFGAVQQRYEADGNTNLPSTCEAEKLWAHITHNTGECSILDARCVETIRLLQAANRTYLGKEPPRWPACSRSPWSA
jgi:hypothetical protein